MIDKRPIPTSIFDLFWSFTLISTMGFGGVVAIIQYGLVEQKQWLTKEEFVEEWSVAQILPGPNVVNLSVMVGARYFGWQGALAALSGVLLVPLIITLILGVLYAAFSTHPGVAGAIQGMSSVAAGLIIATGLKLFAGLKTNPLGKFVCAGLGVACFIGIALLHWPLLNVLFVLGSLGWLMAYRILKTK